MRIFLFIFTIELFYRLGVTLSPSIFVVLAFFCLVLFFSLWLIAGTKKKRAKKSVGIWNQSLLLFIYMAGAVYGLNRGVHEIIVAPVTGKPVYAEGSVLSVAASPKYKIMHLVLTSVEAAGTKRSSKLNVIFRANVHTTSNFTVGNKVKLMGVLTTEQASSKASESWLINFLQPAYQFHGKVSQMKVGNVNKDFWWEQIRRRLHQAAQAHSFNQTEKIQEGLLESIVFGGNTVSNQMHQVFLRAGVLHILAASGANMLFMERIATPVLFFIFGRLPFGRWVAFGGLFGFIWFYAALCQGEDSILRAAWMSSYRAAGRMVGRTPSTGWGLLFAAFCLTLWNPGELWSVRAILSFVATYAVDQAIHQKRKALSMEHLKGENYAKSRILASKAWIHTRNIIWTSISVELYTAPLVEVLFGQWTPYAIVSNLLIEPILVLLLPLAAVWFALVLTGSGQFFVHFVFLLCTECIVYMTEALENVLTWIAYLPGSLVKLPVFPPVWFLGYYTCLVLFSSIRPFVRTFLKGSKEKLGLSTKRL